MSTWRGQGTGARALSGGRELSTPRETANLPDAGTAQGLERKSGSLGRVRAEDSEPHAAPSQGAR